MKIECETDVLWPTRVRITLDNYDIWMSHDDARVLRDQLTSLLKPVPRATMLEIAKATEGWK